MKWHQVLPQLVVAVVVMVYAGFGLQGDDPKPIPPYEGDGNAQHDGQPRWCQNYSGAYAHNCDCTEDDSPGHCAVKGETAKCKVYCRKSACGCINQCNTR